ncbi:MOSC domain-containing protein [Rhodophyticola porphyridii]|uniref:Sulfurase n=1 Tax=Rhodophyticola porphyridii TaxID=1852017 RepID=A0A3L9Y4Z7_9RHOB|nr:MOSC domain-containing protein [Rhodophyticola porphyridii]RMA43442.1 sulfurase [Rhodophyticola porphyridii]
METLSTLTARHARDGRLDWIGLRPARRAGMISVQRVGISETGLDGDHRTKPGKRAVTLVQAEHLPVIAAFAGLEAVTPQMLRRNLMISRINLAALRGRILTLGAARLRITGPCAPCSRMEEALGPGGYTAMRGHGGWTAEVVTPGTVQIGNAVSLVRP